MFETASQHSHRKTAHLSRILKVKEPIFAIFEAFLPILVGGFNPFEKY